MKKIARYRTWMVAAAAVTTVLCMSGCIPGCRVPFSVEITVPMGEGYTVPNFGLLPPGTPFPERFTSNDIEVCNLPTEEEIREAVAAQLGDVIANLIDLETVALLATDVAASQGDFSALDYVGLLFQPKDLNGAPQAAIDFGSVTAPPPLTQNFSLVPPAEVDFLDITNDNANNPNPDCPTIVIELDGTVPTPPLVFGASLRLRVDGSVGF